MPPIVTPRVEWAAIAPEAILAVGALILLVLGALIRRRPVAVMAPAGASVGSRTSPASSSPPGSSTSLVPATPARRWRGDGLTTASSVVTVGLGLAAMVAGWSLGRQVSGHHAKARLAVGN
ncbi:MAG: hypothetical protein ACYDAD_09320, partial [Acidimicrobiales bacterium]